MELKPGYRGMKKENSGTAGGAENVEWDLSDLYQSPEDPALIRDREHLKELSARFSKRYKEKVATLTPEELLLLLQEYESILECAGRIGSYAHLIWSTDTENAVYGKLVQEANELGAEIQQQLVFFRVEWLQLGEKEASKRIDSPVLASYRHYLAISRLYKSHTLEEGQEQVLAAKSVTGRSAWARYFDETMGSARYELDGESLTQQQVLSKLHSTDRELRQHAHQSVTRRLQQEQRTLTYIFNTLLADKYSDDKLRNYSSWVSSRNLSNQIDDESVETLVGSVTDRYDLVQRYYRLKRDILGYEKLYDYDRYAPIVESEEIVGWNDARSMVIEAFTDFHPQMGSIADTFFEKNWIDAAIRPGKRGGAYSASTVTTVHPYIFMNYDGRLRDVQTLAHELGHGVHQYLARVQGELQSSTPLTTAETASVFAEMLVFEKLMERLDDPKEKLALLTGKIDDTIATVFRQISMNRFEESMHTARRETGELTTEQFSQFWHQTQQDLYGESVSLTEGYRLWWSYIPHFLHTPGYVYAYAFGELLVLALYKAYKEGGNGFEDQYLSLLEAGGSDWPHNLVAELGIDIRDPEFWNKGLNIVEEMIEEAEQLNRELREAG
jgi:oligoendopeptidase F